MTPPASPATGAHTTNGIPHGFTSLTPFIVVTDAAAAIDFYTRVFSARLISRMDSPDGSVLHAELDFGQGRLQLADANPDYGLALPEAGDAVSASLCLYCADADAVVAAAEAAGATEREPIADFVSGDRYGSIIDPFGRRWAILTRVEDLSDEESAARVAEWAQSMNEG
ncbi:VOC family protein [Brevibacterium luteolum]|uniref:VOC family protein n=1 Tax=Brevibacterium luteolum TaxID=199591 RepID=A0A849ASR6_9MICO|nr:VOC family protein [Brevibacterium luteolum]MBM7530266.1 PhnB protein [Brevibacterium luteolum]NNG79907.1 VOC family protein [Brevibacterium luteolum]